MIVVYGGTSSGKSEEAEKIACLIAASRNKKLFYMATMEKQSEAAKKRIEHHKKMREGKGFVTIEEEVNPAGHFSEVKDSVVLLECLSNLWANVFFKNFGEMIPSKDEMKSLVFELVSNIKVLDGGCTLVVVTNNIFGAGKSKDKWCDTYMLGLGLLNQLLAEECSTFVEVVCGQKFTIKGENYWQ